LIQFVSNALLLVLASKRYLAFDSVIRVLFYYFHDNLVVRKTSASYKKGGDCEMEISYPKKTVAVLTGLLGVLIVSFSFVTISLRQDNNAKNSTIELQEQQILKLRNDVDLLTKVSWINVLQHQIESIVSTDRFIVQKISFGGDTFTGKLSAIIDLDIRPAAADKYKGQNNLDLTNQELLSDLNSILTGISKLYDNFKDKNTQFPEWKTGEYTIKFDRYIIGTYSNGELKLTPN
jgi:hypothetical protein